MQGCGLNLFERNTEFARSSLQIGLKCCWPLQHKRRTSHQERDDRLSVMRQQSGQLGDECPHICFEQGIRSLSDDG